MLLRAGVGENIFKSPFHAAAVFGFCVPEIDPQRLAGAGDGAERGEIKQAVVQRAGAFQFLGLASVFAELAG